MVLDALSLGDWVRAQSLSGVRLFAAPWTVAHQTPLSMGFPRPEYWSGWPCPPPGDLPVSLALAGGFFTTEPPGKPLRALQQMPTPGGNRAAPRRCPHPPSLGQVPDWLSACPSDGRPEHTQLTLQDTALQALPQLAVTAIQHKLKSR